MKVYITNTKWGRAGSHTSHGQHFSCMNYLQSQSGPAEKWHPHLELTVEAVIGH